jgi:DNA-binding protein HU-beta
MRKQDLIREVAHQAQLPESRVTPIVNAVFQTIQNALANGDEVAISGFGTFRVVERPARVGRNPQTREEIRIGPRKTPVFRAGASLKRAVGDTDEE